ncbi:MAG: Bax inhibitor-1/YccA family protein [Pseudomonadota bacterium]
MVENNRYAQPSVGTRQDGVTDQGLRSHMLGIYNYMAGGVALTGVVAFATSMLAKSDPAIAQLLYASPLKWVLMLAPLGFVFFLGFRIHKMSVATAQITFWAYAALMGVSLSSIFLVFAGQSIAQVFFVTAAAFAALSVFGYTTSKDLSGWGSFLFMGLIGIIIAAVVNLFLQSSALMFAINVIGVLVFAGLTAYDTQRLKDEYYHVQGNAELMAKSSIMGALSLYLNFVNMFMMLLQLFGSGDE